MGRFQSASVLGIGNLIGGFVVKKTYSRVMDLIFEIRDSTEGGYYARALGHAIFTEGETWNELRANILEAVELHFEDGPVHPRLVQMHYVKDELISVEAA